MSYATNISDHGGKFFNVVDESLKKAKSFEIATGYVGADTVNHFSDKLIKIADDGGVARILVGMAFYEGIPGKQEDILKGLNEKLESTNSGNGVFVSVSGRYHGKIYSFDINETKNYYVGSSNFSPSGLKSNKEFTMLVKDENNQKDIQNYLDYLFDEGNSANIKNVKTLSAKKKKRINADSYSSIMNGLEKYDPNSILNEDLELAFSFPLERSASKEKSHLNVYFAKGRLNRATGIVTPRPWYEAELIAPKSLISAPGYPIGKFTAYTDDGYIIPMKTSGDYNKNIQSSGTERGTLQLFGAWIKGKMEQKGVLDVFKPFDLDVLEAYGSKELKFYKIKDSTIRGNNYYLEF
jgi:HKD family nuclease